MTKILRLFLAMQVALLCAISGADARMSFDGYGTDRLAQQNLRQSRGRQFGPPAFVLSQLPAGAVIANWDMSDAASLTIASGKVTAWRDKVANRVIQNDAVPSRTAAYAATGWDGTLPAMTFNGTATFGQFMVSSDFVPTDKMWVFMVLQRTTQNGSATNSATKIVANLFRPSDNKSSAIYFQRPTVDAAQTAMTSIAWGGGGSTISPNSGFGNGSKGIIKWDAGQELRINSSTGTKAINFTGTATAAQLTLGGTSTDGSCAGYNLAEILVVNSDLLKGDGTDNMGWVIEGMLAAKWGIQTQLAVGHPFRSSPPAASDWTNNAREVWTWGNSIAAGFSPFVTVTGRLGPTGAGAFRGVPWHGGGVGGDTSKQIRDRFDTAVAANPNILEGTNVIGEMFTNGDGGDGVTTRQHIVYMADRILAAGGKPVILDFHIGNSNAFNLPRTGVEAENTYLRDRYPNNFLNVSELLRQRGAPGAFWDDPINFPLGRPPKLAMRTITNPNDDPVHYNDTAYEFQGNDVGGFIDDRGMIK